MNAQLEDLITRAKYRAEYHHNLIKSQNPREAAYDRGRRDAYLDILKDLETALKETK